MQNLDRVAQFGRAPSLIAPTFAPELASLASSPERNLANTVQTLEQCAQAYGVESTPDKPFLFAGGIAVIPVYGALLHRDSWCSSYATGYSYIQTRLAAALGDKDVKGIIFDLNSYGGHVAGNFELCDQIYEGRSKKPMMALVDSRALSGGYSIASATGRIIATPSADIGSIGVVMMHMSMEKALKNYGVEVTFIFAGKHKVDGNPFEDLPADVKKALQASVEKSYEQFVSLVARNRGMDAEAVRNTEARVYDADEAKSLGLIDEVAPPSVAFTSFLSEVSKTSTQTKEVKRMDHIATNGDGEGGNNPSTVTAADAAAQSDSAATAARTAEQARIGGIIGSDEAKKRGKLANHLAFKTSMSVEDAKVALAAAAEEKDEEPAAAAATKHDPLAAAIKQEGQPVIGAEGGDEGDQGAGNKSGFAQRASQAYAKATGVAMKTTN